jgi:hypothetical protein
MTEVADAIHADLVRLLTVVLRNREAAQAIGAETLRHAPRRSGSPDDGEHRREVLGRGLRMGLARVRVGRLRRWLGAVPIAEVARPAWLPASHIGLWHDLGAVRPGLRAAVVLGILHGDTPTQVAHTLAITPGTAHAWLVTARLQLNPPSGADAAASAHERITNDDELRAELRSLEQSVPVDRARGAERFRSPRSWATFLRTAAILVAVVAVAGLGTRLLAGGTPGPDDSTLGPIAQLSPSTSAEPAPSETLPPIPSRVSWNALPFQAAVLRGAARIGERWIVTGRKGNAAAAWYADDLTTWKAARVEAAPVVGQLAEMGALAAHGTVLLAVGSSAASATAPPARALAWISTDRGVSWRPVVLPSVSGALTSVAAGPGGFVAVDGWLGCCGPQTPARVLLSADGRSWRTVTVDGLGDASVNAVAGDGRRYVLVGQQGATTATTIGQGVQPRAWSSTDGLHWTPAELPTLEGGGDQAAIAASASPWGFMAAGLAGAPGSGNPQGVVTWSSDDGTTWTAPTPVTDAPNPDAVVLSMGPNRLLMGIGLAEAPGASWSTIDGVDWWPDDAVPQIHAPVVALSDHQLLMASNCAAYLSDCPGPVLFTGSFDPAPAH